jgi:hypothetical protein
MNCTPSAKLEEEYGEKKSSVYAAEGTLAHELSELYLLKDALNVLTESDFEAKLEVIMANELFSEEMLEVLPIYTDYCLEQLAQARAVNPLASLLVEQKIDLTAYVPESFGTADCVIINDKVMEVIDLKYGKGLPVHAEENKQLMLYGLGALLKYDTMYDIEEVRVTIVQPRLDNISSWVISVSDLLDWAENELRPRAELAFNGEGELCAGAWCQFYAVKNRCRKLYEQQIEIAQHEFAEPELLTDDEIADIVLRVPKLVEWANSIAEYAQHKSVSEGKVWPGLKLVEGISRRKWCDEDNAGAIITERCPELSDDQLYNVKLKPITAIEKLVGKKRFEEVLSDQVVKPQGKPTLVPLSDKRPALGVEDAVNDFK